MSSASCTLLRLGKTTSGKYRHCCSACGAEVKSRYEDPAMIKMVCRASGEIESAASESIGASITEPASAEAINFPSLSARAMNYAKAQALHTTAGRPRATQETIDARFTICLACPLYSEVMKACSKCGCRTNRSHNAWKNKLAMANELCPDNPPRWLAVRGEN